MNIFISFILLFTKFPYNLSDVEKNWENILNLLEHSIVYLQKLLMTLSSASSAIKCTAYAFILCIKIVRRNVICQNTNIARNIRQSYITYNILISTSMHSFLKVAQTQTDNRGVLAVIVKPKWNTEIWLRVKCIWNVNSPSKAEDSD